MQKRIGYIGLGKMGKNMVLRLLEKQWTVIAYNRSPAPRAEVAAAGAVAVDSINAMIAQLATPRLVWCMVSHEAVDAILAELIPLLAPGDMVIDGGNSPYVESMRRAKELEAKGLRFLDAGVSGGPGGARSGACVMVGGKKELFLEHEELFKDIATEDGYAHFGSSGAGHFVKMVHNGIEYGMMQAIAEGFTVMKQSPFNLNLTSAAELYNHQSVVTSRLVGWLRDAFRVHGEDLKGISGSAKYSGEGGWTVEAAKKLGVPTPIIAGAVAFREQSQKNPSYTGKVISALRNQFGQHEVGEKEA